MGLNKKRIMLFIVSVLLWNAAHSADELHRQTLPRSFGPLTLGMSEQAFTKITALKTYACECARDEYTAAIDVTKFPNVYPPYIYSFDGFDIFTYKGKLYKIGLPPEAKDITAAKEKYSKLFGPPSKTEDWPNGVSWVRWENKTTMFVLAYSREKTGTFPYTKPAGTVTLVQYIDKPLRNALEAQEKKKPTREHSKP